MVRSFAFALGTRTHGPQLCFCSRYADPWSEALPLCIETLLRCVDDRNRPQLPTILIANRVGPRY